MNRAALILALCASLAACGGGNVADECADYSAPVMMAPTPTVGAAALAMPPSQSAPTIGTNVAISPAAIPAVGDDGACK